MQTSGNLRLTYLYWSMAICASRQEQFIPGALFDLKGAVPVRARGPGHTVPTYFVGARDQPRHRSSWIVTIFLRERILPVRKLKKQLRAGALARRDALDPGKRTKASHAMAQAAMLLDIDAGTIVSGFLPIRSEVDIRPLMFSLMDKGVRLCLPAILDKTTIVFRAFERNAPLVDMGFGTLGPGEDAEILEPATMLVPLAAFDARGHRIGYGAGYYDRFISTMHAKGILPRLIGIAFDCQLVDMVPNEDHDVQLHEILTESGLHPFPLAM